MEKSLYHKLPRPFLVLAPMYDVTDTVFRQIVAGCAPPDLYFTEFVNVDGLQSPGRKAIEHRLKFTDNERPIIAQVWGKKPDNFRKTAAELVEMGFDGIDINFGCPDKAVVKNGCCIAMINDRPLAAEIIHATQGGAGKLPVSVKTRLGFNEIDLSWLEFLLEQNLNMLTIHGRTKKEMSNVPAHWDEIGRVRQLRDRLAPQTLIVGNGDVMDREKAEALAAKYQLDGIMIGRGVFHDPFAFSPASPWPGYSPRQKADLYKKHVELFIKTWGKNTKPIQPLNKFCKIYINGFEGAKELREHLMQAVNADDLINMLNEVTF